MTKAERGSGKRARNKTVSASVPARGEIRWTATPTISNELAAAAGGVVVGSLFGPVGGLIGAAAGAAMAAVVTAINRQSRPPERVRD